MRARASSFRQRIEKTLWSLAPANAFPRRAIRWLRRRTAMLDGVRTKSPVLSGGREAPSPATAGVRCSEPFSVAEASMCVNLNQCNLHCIMCWTLPDRERQARGFVPLEPMNMPRERLLALLHSPEIDALESLSVVGGGEPFVYPFIDDLLREGPTETRRLMIMTHGGLIHRRPALWESARTGSITLTFSIDAATAPTYSEIRKGGDWSQLVENVERWAEVCRANPEARLNASYVVLERNLDEVLPFLEMCRQWNAAYVHFHPAIAGSYPDGWRVDRSGHRYLSAMREAFEFARANRIGLDTPEELLTSPEVLAGAVGDASGSDGLLDPRRSCRLHSHAMTISHAGEVFVCDTAFRISYSCGNAFRDGVAGAWASEAWTSLRQAHRDGRPESHPLCSRCLLLE